MAPYSTFSIATPVQGATDLVGDVEIPHIPKSTNDSNETQSRNVEPIAIVGMACRLPGDASSSTKLWDLLVNGRSGQCEFPPTRLNIDGFYKPKGDLGGALNMRGGCFIQEDIRNFDNNFFGINNVEATQLDPQQRKLLEVVFECFESAGVPLETLSGSNTGCYVGNFSIDYPAMQMKDIDEMQRYLRVGTGTTLLSNRISHVFNLNGPSLVIDTACSSSMYCLHTAVTALEAGDCDSAIVAAANLIQSVEEQISLSRLGVLSKTSTCHTFDESADGYARADAIGALYLKRLSDAIRDGDPIRSVIRGTAVNCNGKTQGITLPSAEHQEKVIRAAYKKAGLDLRHTTYVECHGTGTVVGDTIEVDALSRVFKGSSLQPIQIGSVKTNLGHGEAASALSSVMKVTMTLENKFIPPTIGVKRVNPKINQQEMGVEIVTEGRPWPTTDPGTTLRAGVNSFGYGGANGHAILESASTHVPPNYNSASRVIPSSRMNFILPFSASTSEALEARVSDLSAYRLDAVTLQDLAYTLGCRRSHLEKRGYVIVSDESFHKTISLSNHRTLANLPATDQARKQLAFVFTGQGAQWPQMCMELFGEFRVFSDAIKEMDSVLQGLPRGDAPKWTLKSTLIEPKATSRIMDPVFSQPACTAIQVALVLLLQSWGIAPAAVVGHSSGEIAAAFAAGFISLAEAITIAYYRGLVVGKNTLDGGMVAAGLSENDANETISALNLGGQIGVACINSPSSVTISGDAPAIDILLGHLAEQGIFGRRLQTHGRAYHSHHMLPLGDGYENLLRATKGLDVSTKLATGAVWFSSVTGEQVEGTAIDSSYWRQNLESPVEFVKAITRLTQLGSYHAIELGPHSALELPIKQIKSGLSLGDDRVGYSAAIVRNKDATHSILNLAGQLYLHGYPLQFDKINGLDINFGKGPSKVHYRVLHDLPPYRWTYPDVPLWHEPRISSEFRFRKYPRHELLGSQVPGGNGVDYSWKNILRLDESGWLKDHKLNTEIVFPGAGYFAMAVEAIRQVSASQATLGADAVVHMKNVNILSALALPSNQNAHVELCTTMRPTQISCVSTSSEWWDFSIVSIREGVSTKHTTGTVRMTTQDAVKMSPRVSIKEKSLESSAPRIWYDKLAHKGVVFGPEFRTVNNFAVSRLRTIRQCQASVPLKRELEHEVYPVHPVTIDAMLQVGIIATTAGNTKDLAAKVPTCIGSAVLSLDTARDSQVGTINAEASVTGFGCGQMNAELLQPDGRVKVRLENVRLAPYEASQLGAHEDQRHPMLRVLWRPDASPGLLTDEDLSNFLETSAQNDGKVDTQGKGDFQDLLSCLSIMGHKNPYMKVLELGGTCDTEHFSKSAMEKLEAASSFPRLLSYTTAHIDTNGQLLGRSIDLKTAELGPLEMLVPTAQFDLIILPKDQHFVAYPNELTIELKDFLSPWGSILTGFAVSGNLALRGLGSIQAEGPCGHVSILCHIEDSDIHPQIKSCPVRVIERAPTDFGDLIMEMMLNTAGQKPTRVLFDEVSTETVPPSSTIISLLELEDILLANSSNVELDRVKVLTDQASSLIWVTGGGLLDGQAPDHSLIFGISRTLLMEQPSLRFFAYDVDNPYTNPLRTARNIVSVLSRIPPSAYPADFEFMEKAGLVHVSRFVPDDGLNDVFRKAQGAETARITLAEAQNIELAIRTPGQFGTIFFKQIDLPELGAEDVQVSVKAVGLNAKDFYALGGRVDTKNATCVGEFSGVVEKVGSKVSDLSVGDRVAVMAAAYFRSSEVVPRWACQKLEEGEDFSLMSTVPVVYSTALYALHNRASLQPGESVLIHSGAGGVGMAAIQIAQMAGAEIFTTVSTEEKSELLVQIFGIKPENIFSSRDSSFEAKIMEATNGNGVDVVLNSFTGDLLRASWRCCAPFGRFVEIGKKDLMDCGQLEMDQFLKGTTYTAFDLAELYNSPNPAHNKVWADLLVKSLKVYRENNLKPSPLEVFDIGDLSNALRKFGSRNRAGKIAISFEDPGSILNVEPFRYSTTFHSEKSYLMIGCLGGLGRSLSKWMLERGARKFVYLGRSGLDKPAARRLIEDLTYLGAECKVVRGDVSVMDDVQRLVEEADGPIGGVIQAAMGLNHALWSTMPNEYWHTGIDPKVRGTWNIHNAIKGRDSQLDVFLLTSSISGSVGTATESNYCAANYFLDNFARYRRSLGLPATSVGLGMISEVGYLHENPDIETLLLRKGIHQINESEMLSIIDASLSQPMKISRPYDINACAHVLTGLEPFGMLAIRKKGFSGNGPLLKSARAIVLARAIHEQHDLNVTQDGDHPAEVAKAIESGVPLSDAITAHVAGRFGDLVLLPADKVNINKSLDSYGMDSMIAAEFRSWFHQAFKVDIPFLELLNKATTVQSLSTVVLQSVESRKGR